MLVVVHDRNVEILLQTFLNGKALGRFDVFKVDSSERRSYLFNGFAELVGVFLVHFYIENVDASIYFKEESLSFHDGFAAHGTNVAKAQNGRSVADDGHEVALVGVFIDVIRVLLYFKTRISHTRRVGQRQVGLCAVGLGGGDFDFARAAFVVIFQCCLFSNLYHSILFV